MSAVVADYRIKPVFDIADNAEYRAWHIPMGDVRRLDEVLSSTEELKYRAMGAHHYMM
jgi:rhodanese-related sulfurtransferase